MAGTDGTSGSASIRAIAQRTLAKARSTRLNSTVDRASRTSEATSSAPRLPQSGPDALVDHVAVGGEQDRERVPQQHVADQRDLQVLGRRLQVGQGEQARREVEPQAHRVAGDVADVAIEDVERRQHDRHGQVEAELDDGDDRDQQQRDAEPMRVEQHDEDDQRDQAEGEVDDGREARGDRQHELRELDLPDQRTGAGDRVDPVVDRRLEPLPGQDRGEDEDRVVGLARAGR